MTPLAFLVVASGGLVGSTFLFVGRLLLERFGVRDVPNARSSHTRITLRGGGIAPLAGLVVALAVLLGTGAVDEGYEITIVVLVTAGAAATLGLVEDIRGLGVATRMLGQVAVGLVASSMLVWYSAAAWPLVFPLALALAAYINIANFMDGVNAMSAFHGMVAGSAFAMTGVWSGRIWLVTVGLLILVLFLGFLPWNVARPGIFLGDVGSYLLGALIAACSIAAWVSGVPFLAAFGVTLIYVVDTVTTVSRRIRRGEKWYEPHRSHVYQQLTDLAISHVKASALVSGFSVLAFLAGALTLMSEWWAVPMAISLMVLLSLAYLMTPMIFGRRRSKEFAKTLAFGAEGRAGEAS